MSGMSQNEKRFKIGLGMDIALLKNRFIRHENFGGMSSSRSRGGKRVYGFV